MKKEIKEEQATLDGFHAKEYKLVKLSLQDVKATEEAIKFNKEHNYEYKFIAENLINTESLIQLIRNGYQIAPFNDFIFKYDVIIIYHNND